MPIADFFDDPARSTATPLRGLHSGDVQLSTHLRSYLRGSQLVFKSGLEGAGRLIFLRVLQVMSYGKPWTNRQEASRR